MQFSLTDPIFTDEDKAREHFEAIRWPNGPVCPHCGATPEHITLLAVKVNRPGLYQCNACRGKFTVTVGTVMERQPYSAASNGCSASHLMAASKKGYQRTSDCTACSASPTRQLGSWRTVSAKPCARPMAAARRRRQVRRSRRNLCRRQGQEPRLCARPAAPRSRLSLVERGGKVAVSPRRERHRKDAAADPC